MTTNLIINQLALNSTVILSHFQSIDKGLLHYRPTPDSWNLIEVLCHLRDEEIEDWRTRLTCVLENPSVPPPPINPAAWVKERDYDSQNVETAMREFDKAREESIVWLKSLKDAAWTNIYAHPSLGNFSGYRYLHNWLAHDYLHLRQIIKLKYNYLSHNSPEDLTYAGTW